MLRQQELLARVEYNSFGFQESDDSVVPVPFPDAFEDGVFLQEHVHRFDVFSAGHTHRAAVTVRVWDGEPAPAGGPWDEQGEVDYESVSGDVAVWGPGRAPDLIRLERAGLWRVRVSCTGRQEVARVTEDGGSAVGVERYEVDFWPKAV
ncbi:hypothetical protein ACWCQL_15950 [Streptomyces sp. NPDC002073]